MRFLARTAEETAAVGARLFHALPVSRALFIIYLSGDLGAGKTTLARGFLRAGGIAGPVRSPTYTLLEVYELAGCAVLHLDLYRLQDPAELEQLGLREWARAGHAWLVEWPEHGTGRLPAADLTVSLRASADAHEINVTPGSTLGEMGLRQVGPVVAPLG
ncbi:MAG TPA: tRNA (adenosine(37)-N6)-threonylcarbamoyltransferase complex ATPase subunit type 1 TsaE [Steroidobacteraceae bacterium]